MYVNKKRQRESHIKCSLKILNSLAFQTTISIEASWFEPENSHPSDFGSQCAFHRCRWFWKCIIPIHGPKAHTHWIIYILCDNQYTNIIPRIEWMNSLTNIIQTHFIGGWDSHFLGWDPPTKLPEVYSSKRPLPKENTVHVTPCIASTKTPACHSGKLQVMLVDSRPGCFLGQFFKRRGSNRALKKGPSPVIAKSYPGMRKPTPALKKNKPRHGLWQPFSGLQRPKTAKKGHHKGSASSTCTCS